MDFEFDCFLSHNSHDKPAVRALAERLAAAGIRVWLDEDQLVPGRNWQPLLEKGIARSATGAVLIGADGLGPWEDEEMQVLLRQAVREDRPVIPVLLPGAQKVPDLPPFLSNRTWVDLRDGLDGPGLANLLWGIRGERPGRDGTAPGSPSANRAARGPAGQGTRPRLPKLRVFLASPGDLADERGEVRKTLDELPLTLGLAERFAVQIVAWDAPDGGAPMLATMNPQEAIAAGLTRPSQCHLCLVLFGWRMGTPVDPAWQVRDDGRPYRSGTEWEYRDALAAAEATGSPLVLVYRKTGAPQVRADDPGLPEVLAQFKAVQDFFAEFVNPDGTPKRAWTGYDRPTALAERVGQDLARLIPKLLDALPPPADSGRPGTAAGADAEPADWDRAPYPGLRALRFEESRIFFGRGRETDALLAKLADPACRFLAVYGASGSGKSSLVWAGLLPRLAGNALDGSKDWRAVRFTPAELTDDDPFLALAAALIAQIGRPGWEARGLARRLRAPEGLARTVREALDGARPHAKLVLFVDQMEELFRLPEPVRALFVECLAEAADAPSVGPRLRLLATLRADFVPELPAHPRLVALFNQGQYLLEPAGQPQRVHMVAGPARRAGIALESELPERIVRDTGDEPGALPLMAYALEQLYLRELGPASADAPMGTDGATGSRAALLLTHAAYEALGGVHGVVATKAQEVFDAFAAEHGATAAETALADLFRELVQVDSPDAPATRRRAPLACLGPEGQGAALLAERLVAARLLVKDSPAAGPSGGAVVEVAHEALLKHWERLALWIDDRRDAFRLQDLLRRSVADWAASGYRHKYLMRPDRAEDIRRALARLGRAPDATERAYLDPLERARWLLARDTAAWLAAGCGDGGLWDAERFAGFAAALGPGGFGGSEPGSPSQSDPDPDPDSACEPPSGPDADPAPEPERPADGSPDGPAAPERRAFLARSFAACLARHAGEPRVRAAVGEALGLLGDPRFDPAHWHLPDDPTLGFREVPAGPFLMGTDPERDPNGWKDEEPQHRLDLPAYWLARWPVTVAQFAAFVADSGHRPAERDAWRGLPNHPVVYVTWYDARAYCAWLTERLRPLAAERLAARAGEDGDGLSAAARRFWQALAEGSVTAGLPSEPEWEKAARGGDGRIYPWGGPIAPELANTMDTGLRRTCAVGCFPAGASPYSCEDLSGNVWEWTRSLWGKDFMNVGFAYPYDREDGREDLDAARDVFRVLRGGAFARDVHLCRPAVRSRFNPINRFDFSGFRVVWSPFL